MTTLYLEVLNTETVQTNIELITCPSAVCLFIHNVLSGPMDNQLYPVVLVNKKNVRRLNDTVQTLHVVNDETFTKMGIEDCPDSILHCELPVLVTSGGQMIHCGLCSVVRKLVRLVHETQPHMEYKKLLGHHDMCLRACAEVSVWTKFCEVEIPALVDQLLLRNNKDGFEEIPEELIKLEHHFQQPAVIPQIGKRKQQIHNILTNKDGSKQHTLTSESNWITKMNLLNINEYLESKHSDDEQARNEVLKMLTSTKKLAANVEVPGLDHAFAEGAEVTLTDLVLLPCVTYIMNHISSTCKPLLSEIPHVLNWYKRMLSIDVIRKSLLSIGLTVADIEFVITPIKKEQIVKPDARNSKLVKHKVKISTTAATKVLECLKNIDVAIGDNPVYSNGESGLDWTKMPAPVHPAQGDLPGSRITRKCEQLENLALAIQSIAKPGQVIVDFCAGGGHLGILVAYLLPQCQVYLVENKEESIRRAQTRVKEMGAENITLYQSNLDYFKGNFDIGTCLHACGVATDLVLDKCIKARASFVVCPCCYGGIQNTHLLQYPRSQHFKSQVTYQDLLLLAHAADDEKSGKEFMVTVDQDRANHAGEFDYDVTLCSMKPLSCSPKNNLLIGKVKT